MTYQMPRFTLNYGNNNNAAANSNLYRSNTAVNNYQSNTNANTGYNRTFTGLNTNQPVRWTPNNGNNAAGW